MFETTLFVISLIVALLVIFHGLRAAIDLGNRTILKIEVTVFERRKARNRRTKVRQARRRARRNPAPQIAPVANPYYEQFDTGLTPAEEYAIRNQPEPEDAWQQWGELVGAASTAQAVSTQPLNPYAAIKRGNGRS